MGRVGPKEGANLTRHSYCIVNAKSLQSLNIKGAVIEITVSPVVTVNTLPLAKRLSSHDMHHFPALRANNRSVVMMSGIVIKWVS